MKLTVFILIVLMCNRAVSFDLMILHASDINAEFEESPNKIGGFSRILQYVQQRRNEFESGIGPPVLVFMTGNFFGENIWYSIHRWRIVSDFINLLKPDAIALGTREFSDGLDDLTQFISSLKCPVVGTNLIVNERLPLYKLIYKYVTFEIDGKKILVLGYTNRGYITSREVDFLDVVQTIKDECSLINNRNDIDYVIAIGHARYEVDKRIALTSDCVLIIIGSGSNMLMYNGKPPLNDSNHVTSSYPSIIKLSDDSLIPIAHSYINGKYLGELIVKFNDNKELIGIKGNLILMDKKIKQNETGLKLLNHYLDDLDKKKRKIIGKTLTSLDGISCSKSECTLGNLITDAFCDFKATQSSGLYWTTAAIGLINSGSIKSNLNISKDGKLINEAFLYEALPYQEQLITIRISGLTLIKILEHSMKGIGSNAFLQVSGLKVVYNEITSPPEMEVLVRCAECEVPSYQLLNVSKIYDVVTTKYLVEGGDGYTMIPKKKITYSTEIINSLQATMRYLEDYKKVILQQEDRLKMFTVTMRNMGVYLKKIGVFAEIFVIFLCIFY
ncbi:5'-nucleotidase-like [Onthophagus taurus]|uniref:5'-nucleotidase-like n=1 Tax=Onthophagus taurus TaxID=166361 RepID=UPI0039BE2BA1